MSAYLMGRHGGIEAVAQQISNQKLATKEDVAGFMSFSEECHPTYEWGKIDAG